MDNKLVFKILIFLEVIHKKLIHILLTNNMDLSKVEFKNKSVVMTYQNNTKY